MPALCLMLQIWYYAQNYAGIIRQTLDKIHVWFKIANITHVLPIPVYRQTDFTPKWVVVSCLHDTVARFRTEVKFSPQCENRGELTPG